MKLRIMMSFMIVSSVFLFAESKTVAKKDIDIAKEEVKELATQAKDAYNKTKVNKKKKKTESEIYQEEEKKNRLIDTKSSLDLYINSLKKLSKKIGKSYIITDYKAFTIGRTKYSVNENELKKANKFLRDSKELKMEIDSYLSVLLSSKNIKSDTLVKELLNRIKSKYLSYSKKYTKQSNAYEYKSTGKRILINEGLIVDGIYSKRSVFGLEIYIK